MPKKSFFVIEKIQKYRKCPALVDPDEAKHGEEDEAGGGEGKADQESPAVPHAAAVCNRSLQVPELGTFGIFLLFQ